MDQTSTLEPVPSTRQPDVCPVSICIAIYNNARNFRGLIDSMRANAWMRLHEHEILVYNDGSTLSGVDEEARAFCSANHIRYLSGAQNMGVPHSWNRLCEAANSEIIVLANDDLLCGSEDWIEQLVGLFSENERLGIAYWCQRLIEPANGLPKRLTTDSAQLLRREGGLPLLRHNFSGAFFALRKSVWQSIRQPDGSTGFWSDLLSYGEEFDLSAETLNRGYFILQFPMVWDHFQSQTFRTNPEKKMRVSASPYLSLEEFWSRAIPEPRAARSPRNVLRQIARLLGRKPSQSHAVPKLDYSMAMLEKKWTNRTILGIDGPRFLAQMRQDGFPTALESSIEAGAFKPPETITVRDRENKLMSVPWRNMMPDGHESLV